jgi:hypothetical protein
VVGTALEVLGRLDKLLMVVVSRGLGRFMGLLAVALVGTVELVVTEAGGVILMDSLEATVLAEAEVEAVVVGWYTH